MSLTARQPLVALPHTPVYKMHKYFARRPWNIFSDLISQHTTEGQIVLDPFCGGGVTVVEALKLRRKAVGVDVNPLAIYTTRMECSPANLVELQTAFSDLRARVSEEISMLYQSKCHKCGKNAIADWLEWDEKSRCILRVRLDCHTCGNLERKAIKTDQTLAQKIDRDFERIVRERGLWFPTTSIPDGDKTRSLLSRKLTAFDKLFTRRNLLALAILRKETLRLGDSTARDFLMFAFSSSLKWASRQSHLRGKIVEGWAMHAYWIYPKSLEMNVWNVFIRRYDAVVRGKLYSNEKIGTYCKFTDNFSDIADSDSTCILLSRSATELPIPDSSIDAVITDPPYGGNVNYAELSDFWYIWMNKGGIIDKAEEAVINRTQSKSLEDYEGLLEQVFRECHRVLKPDGCFLSTFNSKNFRVVTSFILAASRVGFTLLPENVKYQPPIRPYTTTFHAMQIGAFVGDFIFTFKKGSLPAKALPDDDRLSSAISELIGESIKGYRSETLLREMAYELLIPFLAKNAIANPVQCRTAAEILERRIREKDRHFKAIRTKQIATRRRIFAKR